MTKARPTPPSLKSGPRGGAIPSGRCICDDPELGSVKAVRAFAKAIGECSHCGDRGLNLIPFGNQKLHVRCVLRCYGLSVLAHAEKKHRRVRKCCLSARSFKRLLWWTCDDGGRYGGEAPPLPEKVRKAMRS